VPSRETPIPLSIEAQTTAHDLSSARPQVDLPSVNRETLPYHVAGQFPSPTLEGRAADFAADTPRATEATAHLYRPPIAQDVDLQGESCQPIVHKEIEHGPYNSPDPGQLERAAAPSPPPSSVDTGPPQVSQRVSAKERMLIFCGGGILLVLLICGIVMISQGSGIGSK